MLNWPTSEGISLINVPYTASDRDMLLGYLQRQRDLVLWKLDGLRDSDARSVGTPTGLTIHGVVHHLTDVERSWLRRWFAGQQAVLVAGLKDGYVVEPKALEDTSLADLRAAYIQESRHCDQVVADHSLDDTGANVARTLRWILYHLIEETARHLGHLDLLRELADGQTGEEPAPADQSI
jgi:uncharacterized damage-inducible protein DinB